MVQPNELKSGFPIEIPGNKKIPATRVWELLWATYKGNLEVVRNFISEEPNLAYAQYNYMPPIHLAVREGHLELVSYLLSLGAYDPSYRNYRFRDSLEVIAEDSGYVPIAEELSDYAKESSRQQFEGDYGRIHFPRSEDGQHFEDAVDQNDLAIVESILKQHPEFAKDETYFWGEGILMMPAKEAQYGMIDLLISYGATVPSILKWTQAYYFEQYDGAAYMLKNGMSPNVMNCHHVTILHDMAQKGDIAKLQLLLQFGANIEAIDEEYKSTPLGLAARWGQVEAVNYLLDHGADPGKGGRSWSTPLAWSKKKGHDTIVEILEKAGASQ
ncbi:ankyrin repeat domain-containing protein [Flavitalea sp.]|nr:ankyrin repeat domain-containing protein [Flavitalea sp.]